jgi:hypothetical protein
MLPWEKINRYRLGKKIEKGKEKRERDIEEKQETGQDKSKIGSVRVKYRPKAKRVREQ